MGSEMCIRDRQRRIHFTAASHSRDHFERCLRCGRVWRQTISGDFRIYRYNLRRGIRRLHRIFKPQDDCPVRRIGKIGRTDHASYTRSYGKKSAGHLQRESKTGTFGIERERCRRIGSQCSGLGSQLIGIRYIKKKRAAMQPFSFSINLFITPAKPCA